MTQSDHIEHGHAPAPLDPSSTGNIVIIDEGGGGAGSGPTTSIDPGDPDGLLGSLNRGEGNWTDFGEGATLRYTFPLSVDDLPSGTGVPTGPTDAGVAFANFGIPRAVNAGSAMAHWAEIADITFTPVLNTQESDLYFYGRSFEEAGGFSNGVNSNGSLIRLDVPATPAGTIDNSDTDHLWFNTAPGGFGYRALIHEIGHSLGLSHPGEYDVGDGATYETNADYVEDTTMYSIMSYFSGSKTGFRSGGLDAEIVTARTHDMFVVQQMYGANWDTRSNNTTYGYNAAGTGPDPVYDFDSWPSDFGPVMTIWDAGGNDDWLDLSDDGNDLVLDLEPGAFSSTHGMTNNLSLAYDPGGGPNGSNVFIENARGGSGDDEIFGNGRANRLEGHAGDDTIVGRGGADELYGGADDDLLAGHGGIDFFDGGFGTDTVSFNSSSNDHVITLAGGRRAGHASAGGFTETLIDIENVIGSQGDDQIDGTNAANHLEGLAGDDTIRGFRGADQLEGRRGDDSILGGGGSDTVYGNSDSVTNNASGDDTINTGRGHDEAYGGDGNDFIDGRQHDDWLDGGEDEDTIQGGAGNDTIVGGQDDDVIDAGRGHDLVMALTISGGGMNDGDDTIDGGRGNDTINAGHGDDVVDGGSGDDTINAGRGNDTIMASQGSDDIQGSLGIDEYNFAAYGTGFYVDLLANVAGADTIENVENIRAGSGWDTIQGDHAVNVISGGGGNDSIDGGGGNDVVLGEDGNDTLKGGTGDDLISGGTGTDTANYEGLSAGVTVDLALNGVAQDTQAAGVDTLISIERISASNYGDILAGNADINWLMGNGGNDILFGRAGNDWLRGGLGDDVLEGGEDDDILSGDEGHDAASYVFAAAGVIVSLEKAGVQQNTVGAGLDVLHDIEDIIGSFHNDWLTGDDGNNRLTGGSGNDILVGGDGADSLIGGDDDDVLIGGAGNDLMDGGAGIDWVHFNTAGVAVEVDLSAGAQSTGVGSDQIQNVENVLGSLHDDDLRGDDNANEIWGGAGDDTIFGDGGDDVLRGEEGDDHIYVGAEAPYSEPDDFLPVPPADDDALPIVQFLQAGHDPGLAAPATTGEIGTFFMTGKSVTPALPTAAVVIGIDPGSGADTIQFTAGWGNDEVYGFSSGVDTLDFTEIDAIDDVLDLTFTDTADGVLISYGTNSVLLHDVAQAEISDSDFLL